ncbi:uncharacterized protein N7511_002010 [Penicillium nucicola]|uniref:uncharacterized protein n=1 Tax=Penicillium nucicola TaxID=1850975 RepID=UPI002545B8FE|nr:uncharacterized protein N7511_002010 [Penicillium nucicola]KAJ5769959.1 hypothetical protein N7511_002010 [Penicillium nucicola]
MDRQPADDAHTKTTENWTPASVRSDGSVRKSIRMRHGDRYMHPRARESDTIQTNSPLPESADLMDCTSEPLTAEMTDLISSNNNITENTKCHDDAQEGNGYKKATKREIELSLVELKRIKPENEADLMDLDGP